MKTIIIILLVLVILGLYYYTDFTKTAIDLTGRFITDKVSGIFS